MCSDISQLSFILFLCLIHLSHITLWLWASLSTCDCFCLSLLCVCVLVKAVILDHLSSQPVDNNWLASDHPGAFLLSFLLTLTGQGLREVLLNFYVSMITGERIKMQIITQPAVEPEILNFSQVPRGDHWGCLGPTWVGTLALELSPQPEARSVDQPLPLTAGFPSPSVAIHLFIHVLSNKYVLTAFFRQCHICCFVLLQLALLCLWLRSCTWRRPPSNCCGL